MKFKDSIPRVTYHAEVLNATEMLRSVFPTRMHKLAVRINLIKK